MARKSAKNCKILPWMSAKPDNIEGRFLQIGNSLFMSKAVRKLSAGAFKLYLCMALEAGGKQEFIFPTKAATKFGISQSSLFRHIAELEKGGFIIRHSNQHRKMANNYNFTLKWKADPIPDQNCKNEEQVL